MGTGVKSSLSQFIKIRKLNSEKLQVDTYVHNCSIKDEEGIDTDPKDNNIFW